MTFATAYTKHFPDELIGAIRTALIVTSIVGIVLGVVAILWPGPTIVVVAILFAISLIIAGLFRIYQAFAASFLSTGVRVLLGVVGVIVLLIAMVFTPVRIPHPLVTLSTVLLGATIFSLAGFINAVYARKFDDVAIVPTFILTPLTYLGGVFYSVKLLPDWAEAATHANPIFYMVNAFRYGLLGTSDVPLWIAYTLMIGFIVVLGSLSLWLLKRGTGLRS